MRTFNVFVLIPIVTVLYSIAVMIHMGLFRDPAVFYRYARSWSQMLLRLAGVRVSLRYAEGTAHPTNGMPSIYAANHASLFDIPVLLAYLPDNVRIMYKRELERIPVFGWCLRMSPFIAIDRSNAREASQALDSTAATIRQGPSVMIFPEGTRSADGTLGPFKRGIITLASKASMDIRPVVIRGTAAIMPARTFRVRGGLVELVLLANVALPTSLSRDEERTAIESLRSIMATELTSHHDS